MSYHTTKDGKILSSDQQGLLIPDHTDRRPLVEWLRDKSPTFATTGSKALFGIGEDTDYLVSIDDLPRQIGLLVPSPLFDAEYGSDVTIIHDDFNEYEGKVDYIIASSDRTAEFIFATQHFASIRRDENTPTEVWELLKTNKPLRVAVFRALRHAAPNSTLTH